MNAAAFNSLTSPPSMICPWWSTCMRSLFLMREKETPKGLTQKVVGSTGSRNVMCPATPSSKPYLPVRGKLVNCCWSTDLWVELLFHTKDAKSSSEPAFQVISLFILVSELWRARELGHLHFGLGLRQAWLVHSYRGRF